MATLGTCRLLRIALGLLAAVAMLPPAGAAKGERTVAVEPEAAARAVVERTNAFRREQGREALQWNAALASAARAFAQTMAGVDDLSHEADGREPSQRAERHGYAYCAVRENIAYQYKSAGFGSAELAQALVEGWKGSPGHRRNMVATDVQDIGVGVARSERSGRWYAVQLFGLPLSAQRSFRIANETGATVSYRIGETSYSLPPRVVRTHQRCGADALVLDAGGSPQEASVVPRDGERYVIVGDGKGVRAEQR